MPKGNIPSEHLKIAISHAAGTLPDPIGSIGAAAQATATPNPTPNMFATQPNSMFATQPNSMFAPQSNFYQVKENDKNISDIAGKFGLPAQQLVDVNKSKTLPPEGSYIQLPRPGFAAGPQGQPNASPSNLWPYSSQSGTQQFVANQIQKQIAAGESPNSIPASAIGFLTNANGTRLTVQQLTQLGYVANDKGMFVLAGSPSAPGGGLQGPSAEYAATAGYQANMNKDFLQQLRYDPKKRKLVKIGDLIRQGRLDIKTGRMYDQPMKRNKQGKLVAANRPQQEVAAPVAVPVEPQITRETPQTILDIHLGSG